MYVFIKSVHYCYLKLTKTATCSKISETPQSNLMKIHSTVLKLLHVDRQTTVQVNKCIFATFLWTHLKRWKYFVYYHCTVHISMNFCLLFGQINRVCIVMCYSFHLETSVCVKQRNFQVPSDPIISRFYWKKMHKKQLKRTKKQQSMRSKYSKYLYTTI